MFSLFQNTFNNYYLLYTYTFVLESWCCSSMHSFYDAVVKIYIIIKEIYVIKFVDMKVYRDLMLCGLLA